MKNILNLSTFLFLFLLTGGFMSSCNNENGANKNDISRSVSAQFEFPELLERKKDLSYEEYLKIKEKYDKLTAQFAKDPSDYEAALKIAEIYIYEARVTGEHPHYYNAALKTLDEILKNEAQLNKDQHFMTLFYKATVQLSQHNFNEALLTGQKALAINDVNSGIYGVLVDANVEIGNYKEAVAMCDKMVQLRPDLRSYSRTSYLREIYGDIPGSIEAMKMAINAGAPYSEYKCWTISTLGVIFEEQGQLDSAMLCYEFAATERLNYPFGIAGKARVEAKKGNSEQAEKLFNQAIEILPEIGFYIELAAMKKEQGKTEEVAKLVGQIETMFTEDMESGHNMGLEYARFLYTFKDDYKKALEYGLGEFKNRPNNIDVNKLLAYLYYGLGDKENAKKHLTTALATAKKDADLICLNGLILEDKAEIKKSFKINPYQDHSFVKKAKTYLN